MKVVITFCPFVHVNELVVMITMFEKTSVFKYTWQHPGTKHWHCIDYVIMQQSDRLLCQDVNV